MSVFVVLCAAFRFFCDWRKERGERMERHGKSRCRGFRDGVMVGNFMLKNV